MTTAGNPADMPTTISVPEELAEELYDRKGRGESYADVIWRLLEQTDGDVDRDDRQENTTPTQPSNFEQAVRLAVEEIPGAGEKLARREDAFRAVVEYLEEQRTATPADFKSDVYPDHQGQYGSERSWWKNAMYPALRDLAEHTDQIEKADTTGEWEYSETDQ